jgi:hypothetical protein
MMKIIDQISMMNLSYKILCTILLLLLLLACNFSSNPEKGHYKSITSLVGLGFRVYL